MTQPPPVPPKDEWAEFTPVSLVDPPKDEWAEFTPADVPTESAPAAPQTESGYTHPLARFGAGAVRGFARAFNPVEIARSFKALGELGYAVNPAANLSAAIRGEEPPMAGLLRGAAAAPGAIAEAASTPEGLGDIAGGLTAAAVTPGVLGKTGSKVADLARRSRVTNLTRAVSGLDETVPILERAGDTAELPVSLTQGSLARKLAAREAAADLGVGATRANLPGSVEYADVARRLPQVGESVEGVVVTGDRPLRRAVESARSYYEDLATRPGTSGTIPRSSLAARKTEAQESARLAGAYAKREKGIPVAPRGAASAEEATAVREALLDTAGLSADDAAKVIAHEKALAEASLAKSLSVPARAEHVRRVRGVGGSDWKASLVGRAILPTLRGAGLGAAAGGLAGGIALSPVGALAGAGVATFMRSTAWNTLSAATKLKAIRALESGGVEAFREVVIPAVIADTQRRRAAERALAAQGEGVTTP